ncbi:MAG: glycosyltransferase family 4 protein [Planctomycetota bacterium]
MRVLLVSHHAPPHVGGLENLVSLEAQALVDAGHEVEWLTTRPHRATSPDIDPPQDPCPVTRVAAWHIAERTASIAYPFPSPRFVTAFRRMARPVDAVHVHGFVFPTTILAAFAKPRSKRMILTDHGGILHYRSRLATWTLRAIIETAGRYVTRRADAAIAYNSDVERLLRRLAKYPERVSFLPNPIDLDVFHPVDATERRSIRQRLGWDDSPRALFVGRLVEDKGIDILADAIDDAYRVVYVGPGSPETVERLHRIADVLEPRPQHELADLYRAADVLALPSWNEGFPVVIQEALCCGCPVVTTDTPAYDRYRQLNGLSTCSLEPERVREALLRCLQNAARRDEIAAQARLFFGDPLTWSRRLLSIGFDDSDAR